MLFFDAVVNSIHSIEEKDELSGSDSPSDIVVEIEHRSQGTLGIGTSDDNPEEIIGFKYKFANGRIEVGKCRGTAKVARKLKCGKTPASFF